MSTLEVRENSASELPVSARARFAQRYPLFVRAANVTAWIIGILAVRAAIV